MLTRNMQVNPISIFNLLKAFGGLSCLQSLYLSLSCLVVGWFSRAVRCGEGVCVGLLLDLRYCGSVWALLFVAYCYA